MECPSKPKDKMQISRSSQNWKFLVSHLSPGWRDRVFEVGELFLDASGCRRFIFEDENLEKAVRSAFGFWLFGIDAFGPLTKEGEIAGTVTNGYPIRDLSDHCPALALVVCHERIGILVFLAS